MALTLHERYEKARELVEEYQRNGKAEGVTFKKGNWFKYPTYLVEIEGRTLQFHEQLEYIIYDGEVG